MKYLIYCRKSSESEDRQVLSLESQERELLEYAERHGLTVAKVLKESMSAKAAGRPVFSEAIRMIESGEYDAILCWKLDRLARNFIDGGRIIDLLQRSTIKEIRTYEATHLPNDNVLLLAVQLGMANQYVRDLSTNVKRGNREKLVRGDWPNRPPFGYKNDKATKTIVIDPTLSPYAIRAFDLFINSQKSFREISDVLYTEGLRTKSGKKVFKGTIQRIITNPFYAGVMLSEGRYYKGNHVPLISQQTLEQATLACSQSSRPRAKKLHFPLRGLLVCGTCGCSLTASLKKGHQYYYCTNGKQSCQEHKHYMREKHLYEKISDTLKTLHFDEELVEIMYQAAKERLEANEGHGQHALASIKSQLESLRVAESRLLDAFIGGQVEKGLYDQKSLEIRNSQLLLSEQIRQAESLRPEVTLEPTKEIFLTSNRAAEEFSKADDVRKGIIAKNLLWNLSIKSRNVASIKFKSPYDVISKAPKNADILTLLPDKDSNLD